jgi:FkbM family methyltransferase
MADKLVFDIGANIGRWALANTNNAEQIISIEASPNTFHELKHNCANYSKITCLNYAVCNSSDDEIVFYEAAANTISTLNKDWLTSDTSRFVNTPYREIKCKPISIDTLVDLYGTPDLIKIDVEGAEDIVLHSLTRKCNMICFEWASEMNAVTYNCLNHLVKLGYTKFAVQNEDSYTYRPAEFTDVDTIRAYLFKTIPKHDWGMIWCV